MRFRVLITICVLMAAGWATAQSGGGHWERLNQALEDYAKEHIGPEAGPRDAPRSSAIKVLGDFEGIDLIRAAQQGAEAARGNTSDPRIADLQVEANVDLCLEYFPVMNKDRDQFMSLLYVMSSQKSDPAFREYLIARTVPGLAPPSQFTEYFQDRLQTLRGDVGQRLEKIAVNPAETPSVQTIAIRAVYRLYREDILSAMRDDAKLSNYAEEDGLAVELDLLKAMPPPPLTAKTQTTIDSLLQRCVETLAKFKQVFRPEHRRPPDVRNGVLDVWRKALEELPLRDRKPLETLIEKHGGDTF